MLTPLTSTPSLARMRMYRVPVNHAGLHQVAALRVDVDGDVGSADLQLLGVHQIAGAQAGLRAEGLRHTAGLKGIHMGVGHAAGPERTDRTVPLGDAAAARSSLLALCSSIMSAQLARGRPGPPHSCSPPPASPPGGTERSPSGRRQAWEAGCGTAASTNSGWFSPMSRV